MPVNCVENFCGLWWLMALINLSLHFIVRLLTSLIVE